MKKKIKFLFFAGLISTSLIAPISAGGWMKHSQNSFNSSFYSSKQYNNQVPFLKSNENESSYKLACEWDDSSFTYKITGITTSNGLCDVVIPETYDDGQHGLNKITKIGKSAFSKKIHVKSVRMTSIEEIGDFAFYQCSLQHVELGEKLTKLGDTCFGSCKGLLSIVIPSKINRIPSYAFRGCTALKKVIFLSQDENCWIDGGIFWDFNSVPKPACYYYQGKDSKWNKQLLQVGCNEVHQISSIQNGFIIYKSDTCNKIIGMTGDNLNTKILDVDTDATQIDAYSFINCSRSLEKIRFKNGHKITTLHSEAFDGVPETTLYDVADCDFARKLAKVIKSNDKVGIQDGNFYVSETGLVCDVNLAENQTRVIIPKTVNLKETPTSSPNHPVNVIGINPAALNACSKISALEFENDIKLDATKINTDSFKGLNQEASVCVYEAPTAKILEDKVGSRILAIAEGNFFCNYSDPLKLVGLTKTGRDSTVLEIAAKYNEIYKNFFDGCNPSLSEIRFYANPSLDEGLFKNDSIKNILSQIKFESNYQEMQEKLKGMGVVPKQITAIDDKPSLSGQSKTNHSLSLSSIGIIAGSICVAIVFIVLTVTLLTRKQHKINTLNARLNRKRIDKLSAENAMGFKKVIEATNHIDHKMNGLKVFKVGSKVPSRPIYLIEPQPIQSDKLKSSKEVRKPNRSLASGRANQSPAAILIG